MKTRVRKYVAAFKSALTSDKTNCVWNFPSTFPIWSKQFLLLLFTWYEITWRLICQVSRNWTINYEQWLFRLSDPLYSLRCVFEFFVSCLNSMPDLPMLIILACLEEVSEGGFIQYSYFVGWAKDVLKVIYSVLAVFHCEKGRQVSCVGWHPYEDTEPITAGKNTT